MRIVAGLLISTLALFSSTHASADPRQLTISESENSQGMSQLGKLPHLASLSNQWHPGLEVTPPPARWDHAFVGDLIEKDLPAKEKLYALNWAMEKPKLVPELVPIRQAKKSASVSASSSSQPVTYMARWINTAATRLPTATVGTEVTAIEKVRHARRPIGFRELVSTNRLHHDAASASLGLP
jgi:hypothetical protein